MLPAAIVAVGGKETAVVAVAKSAWVGVAVWIAPLLVRVGERFVLGVCERELVGMTSWVGVSLICVVGEGDGGVAFSW